MVCMHDCRSKYMSRHRSNAYWYNNYLPVSPTVRVKFAQFDKVHSIHRGHDWSSRTEFTAIRHFYICINCVIKG